VMTRECCLSNSHSTRRSTPSVAVGVLMAASVIFSGCASHADRLAQVRSAYFANDLSAASAILDAGIKADPREADVLKLEQAIVSLSAGQPQQAEKLLREVRDRFDELEGTQLANTASYLTDDQRRAYAGEDYEKILLRAMLALTNLMHDGGDAEAFSLQTIAKQEEIIAAGGTEQEKNPKLAYQRVALAPYLRGILREATHLDYDDAERSYVAVVNWQPGFRPGPYDLERAARGTHSAPGNGVLYVFALTGRGPYKQEVVEVPSSAALLIAGEIVSAVGSQTVPPNVAPVKVPRVVRPPPGATQSVAIAVDGQPVGTTETITDVSDLAVRQYEAVFPQVVARAVARRVVKKGAVVGAKEMSGLDKGSLAGFALDMAGVAWEATESADTRCWGLLPDKIQVLRVELPAGEHDLAIAPQLMAARPGSARNERIAIVNGRNTYVLAVVPDTAVVGRVLVSTP
jgi:hypothetical protein